MLRRPHRKSSEIRGFGVVEFRADKFSLSAGSHRSSYTDMNKAGDEPTADICRPKSDSDICCYPLLKYSGISNIPCVFALPDEKSVPRELFDLRHAYFRKICGFSEEGGLCPPMTKSHKDFEIRAPEAGSDTSCQATIIDILSMFAPNTVGGGGCRFATTHILPP